MCINRHVKVMLVNWLTKKCNRLSGSYWQHVCVLCAFIFSKVFGERICRYKCCGHMFLRYHVSLFVVVCTVDKIYFVFSIKNIHLKSLLKNKQTYSNNCWFIRQAQKPSHFVVKIYRSVVRVSVPFGHICPKIKNQLTIFFKLLEQVFVFTANVVRIARVVRCWKYDFKYIYFYFRF